MRQAASGAKLVEWALMNAAGLAAALVERIWLLSSGANGSAAAS